MDIRKLIGVFISLLLLYFVIDWSNSKGDQSFDPVIVQVDTAVVDRIEIRVKDQVNPVILTKSNHSWQIEEGDKSGNADHSRVVGILTQLNKIEALRYASKKKEKWSEYEIDDSATRILAFKGNSKLTDFYVGRFAFNQQARSGTSYIRLAENDAVYAVDGFLSVSFSPGIDAYRDKKLWSTDPMAIQEIQFISNDLMAKKIVPGGWNYESIGVDSAQWNTYLNSISSTQAQNFEYQSDHLTTQPFVNIISSDLNVQIENGKNTAGELVFKIVSNNMSLMVNDKDSVIYKKLLNPVLNEQ